MSDKMDRLADHLKWMAANSEIEWTESHNAAVYAAQEAPDGSIYLNALPIPQALGNLIEPMKFLGALPVTLMARPDAFLGGYSEGFFAWVFRTDGWAVMSEDKEGVLREAEKIPPSEHPDRKEVRWYHAADLHGNLLGAMLVREDGSVEAGVIRPNFLGQYGEKEEVAHSRVSVTLRTAIEVTKDILKEAKG